ncbi:unnamed protein product [Caenorhabditis sp. 36 PRJEB53466]|nr:unnamed protein product [Caenorhabditis sp. 36 PRJEB53466]
MPSSRSSSLETPPRPNSGEEKEGSEESGTPETNTEKSGSSATTSKEYREPGGTPETRTQNNEADEQPATPSEDRFREASPDERPEEKRSASPFREPEKSPVREKSSSSAPPKVAAEQKKEKNDPKDILRTRTGGAYIPPAKLRLMQLAITDKSSEEYQRLNWERMKKKIHGLVNRVNVKNIVQIVRELLQENVIRSKGVLCRDIIQAQEFSPGFSNV